MDNMDMNNMDNIIITNIFWERVFLHIIIKSTNEDFKINEHEIGFYNKRLKTFIPIESKETDQGQYEFEINITCVKNRSFLENGEWKFGYFQDEEFYDALIAEEPAYRYDDLSRIFRYGKGNQYCYTVDFDLIANETDGKLYFKLRSYFMRSNKRWHKRHQLEEGIYTKKFFKKSLFAVKIFAINAFYKLCLLFSPKNGKHVMFMSETKPFINGNLMFLDEEMKKEKLDEVYHITYSFRRAVGSNQSIFSWFKVLFKVARQDYIFVDDYAPIFNYLNLSKKTILVQLWHAGAGFKAVGYCRFGKKGSPYPCMSVHKKYNYGIVGSEKLIKVFEEVWSIDKESILPLGMARLDNYLDPKKIKAFEEEFYKEYPELKKKKIILFAPTYRGKGQATANYDFTKIDFERIYNFCKDEYVFAIKLHPFILDPPPIPEEYKNRIYDFSEVKNINDLYYVSDIMITDYSSSYYEFSLMKRPILFYTYDRCFYELSRGVYQSIKESAPGKVCDTFDELMEALENKDYELDKTLQFVKDNFDNFNNDASKKILKTILNKKVVK